MSIYIVKIYIHNKNLYTEAVVAQEHKRMSVNATVVGSIPTQGIEVFNIFISSL